MKILTGQLKGRTIHHKAGPNLRPSTDLVRQSIFNTLRGAIEGKRVLDVFSGTGALGFEALSNGAEQVFWVEQDRSQAECIEKTMNELGLADSGRVINAEALKTISSLGSSDGYFDLIFLDAPYHSGLGQRAMALLGESSSLCHEETLVVLETHKTEDPEELYGKFKAIKTKKHGDTKITFYKSV